MKGPNFRLYETQALFGAILSVLGALMAIALGLVVFRAFDRTAYVIWYNPRAPGLAGKREAIVYGLTALSVLAAFFAGGLSYNSLGQKRNTRQQLSWIGLLVASLVFVCALVSIVAWLRLNEPVVMVD